MKNRTQYTKTHNTQYKQTNKIQLNENEMHK